MKNIKWELLLLGITFIFGFSYPFMTIVSYSLSPFIANFFKSFLGIIVMLPLSLKYKWENKKDLLLAGFLLGLIMVICPLCQQIAASKVESGKLGFITSMYAVITPILAYIFYISLLSFLKKFSL